MMKGNTMRKKNALQNESSAVKCEATEYVNIETKKMKKN